MDKTTTIGRFYRIDALKELDWLPAAQRGEVWAMEQFFAVFQPQVYRFCRRLLNEEDAQDATQAAFVQAFRALPRFRGNSSVKTWLYRIAMHEALTLIRKRRDTQEVQVETAALPVAFGQITDRMEVEAVLARLKPEYRIILMLRFWEQLTYQEIAEILNLSLPAVTMRLSRAREEFRRCYQALK